MMLVERERRGKPTGRYEKECTKYQPRVMKAWSGILVKSLRTICKYLIKKLPLSKFWIFPFIFFRRKEVMTPSDAIKSVSCVRARDSIPPQCKFPSKQTQISRSGEGEVHESPPLPQLLNLNSFKTHIKYTFSYRHLKSQEALQV